MGVCNPGSLGWRGGSKLHGAMGGVSPTLSQKGEFSMLAEAVGRGIPDSGWGL